MRYLPLFCLLLATLTWGQEQPVQPDVPPEYRPPTARDNDDQRARPASASKVARDAAVITIKGLCQKPAPPAGEASSATCQTLITRAQFEKLTDAIITNMRFSRQRQLANTYPNLLAMAREAEARGLDKSPRFQERLALARVQILSQELIRQIDEDSAKVSQKEIEEYYRNHAEIFEQATLERIFIPNRKHMDALPKDKATPEALAAQRKESEDAMTRAAEELHSQAAAGEDFVKLQKEAYTAAGAADVPPNPSLGQLRLTGLPPAQASAFNLKPGEVSQVLSDGTGHYIYKLDAKGPEPLQSVEDEIRKTLHNQHMEEAIQSVQRPITTELNEAYFGPSEKPSGSKRSKPQ